MKEWPSSTSGCSVSGDAHHLDYPLLSDKGSVVIREFGILNRMSQRIILSSAFRFPGDYSIP